MDRVKKEFNRRLSEVNRYFEFIEKIEADYSILSIRGKPDKKFIINEDLFKILKANGFLLLYNLIESSILNCIMAIFDKLSSDNNTYKQVTEQLKKYWITYKYKHDESIKKETVVNRFLSISNDILNNVTLIIKKDEIEHAGSLDVKKIKNIAKDLGIKLANSHYKKNKHGDAFLKIKMHRNNLAHGKFTFSDIGRDITYNGDRQDGLKSMGLFHFKKYTVEHLEAFISDVERYLEQKEYLL